ncbi:MAG: trimethylamine methyltransferase family protein [Pseudomonadota bacterium]
MSDPTTTAGTQAQRRSRRGGRAAKRQQVEAEQQTGRPFVQPRRMFAPMDIISADELEAIHQASLDVLKEIGIDFLDDEARAILKDAGADVQPDGPRVRFDSGVIDHLVASAPSDFKVHARNPAHTIEIGTNAIANCQIGSAPNVSDLDRGRRPGDQAAFRDLLKLAQMANIIHIVGGYPVEPVDIHASVRHLDCVQDIITLTDKAFHIYSLGRTRNFDGLEMVRIARGISTEQMAQEPSVFTIINASSPLRYDTVMLHGIMEMSARNQVVVITPFTLAGAMAPVTIEGALVQQNAEALAGIAFTQAVRAGAPVIYGGFTSNVDMKSGSPAFGTPEYMKATIVGGQLARRYQVPFRTSNTCAANTVDAQAAWESVLSLWATTMAGGHMIKHGAGWMEGGLTASYEKFIVDLDLLQMVQEFLTPLKIDKGSLAMEAMRDVGPGGHYFQTDHTQARYKDAFYAPILSDWRNFETWAAAGSPNAMGKAHTVWQEMLESYEAPELDPAIAEELQAFVTKRREEGGIETDF